MLGLHWTLIASNQEHRTRPIVLKAFLDLSELHRTLQLGHLVSSPDASSHWVESAIKLESKSVTWGPSFNLCRTVSFSPTHAQTLPSHPSTQTLTAATLSGQLAHRTHLLMCQCTFTSTLELSPLPAHRLLAVPALKLAAGSKTLTLESPLPSSRCAVNQQRSFIAVLADVPPSSMPIHCQHPFPPRVSTSYAYKCSM